VYKPIVAHYTEHLEPDLAAEAAAEPAEAAPPVPDERVSP
jgi:hypothetical protein